MELPHDVLFAIQKLHSAGYAAYPVGGCVRDFLRGVTPTDFDITTSATPTEMTRVFAEETCLDIGSKHGTVTVLLSSPIEITTFRVDGEYQNGRHPSSVSFTRSLYEDLARRDFTVNAMAYDVENARVIDPFGGSADVRCGIIRCVGDAETRFGEDALRMLRALRFAATLNFEIEAETRRAIKACKENLRLLSRERVTDEIVKFATGRYLAIAQDFSDVLDVVLPGFSPTAPTPQGGRISRLAYLLGCEAAAQTLRLSGRDRKLLHLFFTEALPRSTPELLTLLRRHGEPSVRAFFAHHGAVYTRPDGIWELSDLAVSGSDLKTLGYVGREIGEGLERLLDAVMRRDVENERDALLAYLQNR